MSARRAGCPWRADRTARPARRRPPATSCLTAWWRGRRASCRSPRCRRRVDGARRMRRPQHVEREAGPGQPPSGRQRDQRRPGRYGLTRDGAQRPGGLVDRPYGDPADRTPTQRAARPPTWSACRWLSSTNAMPRTPSRARQASTGPSAGPVSTSTTQPGARGGQHDRVALPDVARDDHPARRRPPGWDDRVGTITTVAPASAASSSLARAVAAADRGDATQRTDHQQRARRAGGPRQRGAGHGSGMIGHGDSHARGPPRRARRTLLATVVATGATSAASTPRTVAGATAGPPAGWRRPPPG